MKFFQGSLTLSPHFSRQNRRAVLSVISPSTMMSSSTLNISANFGRSSANVRSRKSQSNALHAASLDVSQVKKREREREAWYSG
jgi:hypothetical protein